MDRRDFLTVAFGSVLGAGASAYGVKLLTKRQATRPPGLRDASDTRRWGMVIDLNKCAAYCEQHPDPDCDACTKACSRSYFAPQPVHAPCLRRAMG